MKVEHTFKIIFNYLLIISLLSGMVYLLFPFFAAIIIGWIIALVVDPVHFYLVRKGINPKISSAIVILVFSHGALVPSLTLVARGSEALLEFLRDNLSRVNSLSVLHPSSHGTVGFIPSFISNLGLSETQITGILQVTITNVGEFLLETLRDTLRAVPQSTLKVLIMVLSVYFFLLQRSDWWRLLRPYSTLNDATVNDLTEALRRTSNTVILTNVIGGLVQATIFGLSAALLGSSFAFLIAYGSFLLAFVPIVGTIPMTAGLTLASLISGDIVMSISWLIVGSVAGVSDNIVKPYIMRRGVSIHPFLALLTVLGGMLTFGLSGLFLGPFIAGLFTTWFPILVKADSNSGDS